MYATSFGILIPIYGISSIIGLLNFLLFNFLSLLAIYCHYKAMTTNPGAVPPHARPLLDDIEELLANDIEGNGSSNSVSNSSSNNNLAISTNTIGKDNNFTADTQQKYRKLCRRCQAFKPARAHHCSICNRCVVKMDHHCPWINNCVGIGNYKLFLQFVCWVFVVSIYAIVLSVAKFLSCIREYDMNACGTPGENLLVIFLMVESVLFALFTLIMIGDQMSVIFNNQTKIEKLKNTKFASVVEINEIFGSSSKASWRWHWLYPTPARFSSQIRDQIYGFRIASKASDGNSLPEDMLLGKSTIDSNGNITPSSMGSPKTSSLDLLSTSNSPDRHGAASSSGQGSSALEGADTLVVRWREPLDTAADAGTGSSISSLHSRKRTSLGGQEN